MIHTVVETPLFQKQWPHYWSAEEQGEFVGTAEERSSRRSVVPSKVEPLTDAELTAHEAKRDLAAELLESVREMKAGKGEVVLSLAVEARRRTGLSQSQFAALLGVSVRTLQGWEQGRKQPSGAARTLLAIARDNPKALLAVAGR